MDLPARLKDYAKTHIGTIEKEYNRQILGWKKHIRVAADAHTAAYNNFKQTLEDIKRQQAEQEAFMRQFAMLAFSLVTPIALSWISGVIQYKLYPRMMAMRNPALVKLLHEQTTTWDQWIKAAEKADYSKVSAKIWGDTLSKYTGHALDAVFAKVIPGDPRKGTIPSRLESSVSNADFTSYGTSLENAVDDEAGYVITKLGDWTESINGDNNFGENILKEMQKQFPGLGMDDKLLWQRGTVYIDDYFDKLRRQYAQDWAYYGHNPVPSSLHFLPFHIELEIWAVWILSTEWHSEYAGTTDEYAPIFNYWVSKDGFDLEKIMGALKDLAGKELLANSKLQPAKSPLAKGSGWVQPIDSELDDDQDSAKKLQVAATRTEADAEMANVLAWAASSPGRLLHGNLDYRPRNLGTISNPPSIFADCAP